MMVPIMYGGVGIFCILSLYKSVYYGKSNHSFLKGSLLFLASFVVAFGVFFSLCGGAILVTGFMGGGNRTLAPYFILLALSVYIFWYGILCFHTKNVNKELRFGGLVSFGISLFIMFFSPLFFYKNDDEFYQSPGFLLPLIMIFIIWGRMIYLIARARQELQSSENPKDPTNSL